MIVNMVVVAKSSSHVAEGNKLYFTQFSDKICTGTGIIGVIASGSAPRDGVMTEFEWKVTPTSVTGCSGELECYMKGGSSCGMKYYSLSITCGTGNNDMTIQTFEASAADMNNHCKAGNEYYKYDISSSEFSNVRAGSCAETTYATSPTASSSTNTNRSLRLSGPSSLLCGLCGGTCASTNTDGNADTNTNTTIAPVATQGGTASGCTEWSLRASFVSALIGFSMLA
jgi:hypothetical protein